MRSGAVNQKFHSRVVEFAVYGLLSIGSISGTAFSKNAVDNSTAEQLVAEAAQARLDGDASRFFPLLRQAVRMAPDYELARWQLGQMQVEDEWLSVEEAQRRATANPRQVEYRELRKAHGESPEGQLALARWCRRNGLNDEARFHWASLLSIDSGNQEAMRALNMRWHQGQLLTTAEIDRLKQHSNASRRDSRRWSTTITRWNYALAGKNNLPRADALQQIRSLNTVDAIGPLEDVTLDFDTSNSADVERKRDISMAFIAALGKMPEHSATESLVRHAVLSPLSDIRADAAYRLKDRPLHDYVPLLLEGLATPLESWYHVTTTNDGSVHYRHTLYRTGSVADYKIDNAQSAFQHSRLRPGDDPRDPLLSARQAQRIRNAAGRLQNRFGVRAMTIESRVVSENASAGQLNQRIVSVLAQTTGQELGAEPRQWWDWWQGHNEYYVPEDRPVYEQNYVDVSHNYFSDPPVKSCFAKGTLVWTKTGQRPIEELEMGDLVLAQNVDTGELAYQPVIGRTVRPPSQILKIAFDSAEVRTTLGHPLWVAGVGWRMAKELGDGAVLHAITGSPRVESIAADGEEEAYNLVVADFNTYFVGESGLLVHDNTPRRPTRAIVPGLAVK